MLTRLQPFFDERFVFATLTQLKKTSTAPYKKVQIRPFLQGGELTFQLTAEDQDPAAYQSRGTEPLPQQAEGLCHSRWGAL